MEQPILSGPCTRLVSSHRSDVPSQILPKWSLASCLPYCWRGYSLGHKNRITINLNGNTPIIFLGHVEMFWPIYLSSWICWADNGFTDFDLLCMASFTATNSVCLQDQAVLIQLQCYAFWDLCWWVGVTITKWDIIWFYRPIPLFKHLGNQGRERTYGSRIELLWSKIHAF